MPFDVKTFWNRRYAKRGAGSGFPHHRLWHIKQTSNWLAANINSHQVRSVIEFGCGDGLQLHATLEKVTEQPAYVGLDISDHVIRRRKRVSAYQPKGTNPEETFFVYDPDTFDSEDPKFRAEAAISIDVLYHLVPYPMFETHMRHLFDAAERLVLVFSTNYNDDGASARHMKHRCFTDWLAYNRPTWKQVSVEDMPKRHDGEVLSTAQFFVFVKDAAC